MLSALSAAVVVAACAGPSEEIDEPAADDETSFTFALAVEPLQWAFPFEAGGAGPARLLLRYNVVEPLLAVGGDGSLAPLLAESFEVSEDGLEYTFTIREAKFHDGSDLVAADVVYSLETAKAGTIPRVTEALSVVETVEAMDDRTVEVTLSRPSQSFIRAMTDSAGSVVPEGSAETMARQPVGTGPFNFDQWREGSDVTLTRFADYWGELPPAEQVTWRFMPDEQARLNALFAGEIDLFTQFENEDEAEAITSRGLAVGKGEVPSSVEALVLNSEDGLFEDERVRQAIAHAIDRETLAEAIFPVTGASTCVWVEFLLPFETDYCPYPYDPDRSRELLAEAGVEDLRIEIKYPASRFWLALIPMVAAQLQDVGVGTDLIGQEGSVWVADVFNPETRNYQAGHASAGEGVMTVAGSCPILWTGGCVDELMELVAAADAALDEEEAKELVRQALELHADHGYAIPMIAVTLGYASRGELVGFSFGDESPTFYDLRSIRVEK